MDDADDDPTTNIGAAAAIRDLVAQVRAHAAAHDLLTDEVLAQIRAQLTNAPADDADEGVANDTPDTAELTPKQASRALSGMSRRQREERRRAGQRRAAQHQASGEPPPDDARTLARIAEQRAEIASVLARTNATPAERIFQTELVLVGRWYLAGYMSAVEATVWWLDAARRFLMPPDSPLFGHGLFDPIAAVRNALEAALAGDWVRLRVLLPRKGSAGEPKIPATARRKVIIAAVMRALRMDNAVATDAEAARHVVSLFKAEGIDLGKRTPDQHLAALRDIERRQGRGQLGPGDTYARDMLELFTWLVREAASHTAGGAVWPLAERLEWGRRLAGAAAEINL